MIRKLLIMFRIAAAVASSPLWSLAAAWLARAAIGAAGWLATPRGVLLIVAAGLGFFVDMIAEWNGGPS